MRVCKKVKKLPKGQKQEENYKLWLFPLPWAFHQAQETSSVHLIIL
jgi:hypothetical protein